VAELAERLAAVLAAPDDHAVVVAVDERDRPIGWVHVERLRLLERPPSADLMGLVVDEGARSRGIGRSLVAAAEELARKWGCRSMVVRTRVSRERAHRFYEREGYSRLKTSHVFEKAL
jgi:GNAT superfamily N-acetyltransferase